MSLRQGDLRHMVDDIFEIDSFKSKMGDDKNICVLSFSVKENQVVKEVRKHKLRKRRKNKK